MKLLINMRKVFDFDLAFEFSRRAISQIDMVYIKYNPSEASINYFIYRLVIIADYLQIDLKESFESNINKLKHRFLISSLVRKH